MSKRPKKKPSERGLGRGLSALMSDVGALDTEVEAVPKKAAKTKPKTKPPTKKATAKKPAAKKASAKKPAAKKSPPKLERKSLDAPSGAAPIETKSAAQNAGVNYLPMHRIDRNPDQPRKYFDKEKLKELTQSIRDQGVLQPILVRPVPRPGGGRPDYQIVAGERRWQAAIRAGLDAMPALVRELSDQAVLEIGVVENVQRADLNPIEEAAAYQALSTDFGRTQEQIAAAVGKSRPHIANMLRLLTLPKRAQTHLAKGLITAGHARAIISAPDPVELADAIAEKNLSVREAEDWVRRIKRSGQGAAPKPRAYKDADTRKAEEQLTSVLGLTTDLRHKGPGGELRIKYKTSAQLEDLIKRLGAG